jgi:NAD(P)-dependent dehydrogenase (short-subunit alcohol dehydrogenase family)
MSTARKVAIVTGASQEIGAEVVETYRKFDYRIVANASSIPSSKDANILAIAGEMLDVVGGQSADR